MKPILLLPALLLLAPFSLAETPLDELLRDALYAEEVTRDTDTAADQYERILSRYDSQRDFAATALFRLAEVRRKQNRKDDAIALYQRLIAEFPAAEKQTALAKENLTALGGQIPGTVPDPLSPAPAEDSELVRIRELEKTSPDAAASDEILSRAITEGYLRVLSHLLKNGVDPNKRVTAGEKPVPLLAMAAGKGNLAMCELLLKSGADPNPSASHSSPLMAAVEEGHIAVIDRLIKQGANVNFLPAPDPANPTPIAPLHMAVKRMNVEIVRMLVDAGADPGKTLPPGTVTPLHIATAQANPELARILLAAGADPDLKAASIFHLDDAVKIQAGTTPRDLALKSRSVELLRLFLPPRSDGSLLSSMFNQAVDEDWPEGIGILIEASGTLGSLMKPSHLLHAIQKGNLGLIRFLLEAGADPNTPFSDDQKTLSPLAASLFAKKDAPLIANLLIFHGATADPHLIERFSGDIKISGNNLDPDALSLVARRLFIPELTRRPTVTLAFFSHFVSGAQVLAENPGENSTRPPSLPHLLLAGDHPVNWPALRINSELVYPTAVTIWRPGEDGREHSVSAFWQGSLDQTGDFPSLEWGDVIELSYKAGTRTAGQPGTLYVDLPQSVHWNLRKRISFPVSVLIGEEEREYLMRGDRILFDPTKPELPLMSALEAAGLLTSGATSSDRRKNERLEALVSRNDWPEIRLTHNNPSDSAFKLKPGDRLKVVLGEDTPENQLQHRRSHILVRARGLPAARSWEAQSTGIDENGITLVQAIADLTGFTPLSGWDAPPRERIVPWYFERRSLKPVLWNDPDLSDILIHRLGSDPRDAEETLRIDLSAAIARPENENTVEAVRKADIILRAGDIVELKLRPDGKGKIWPGLSPAERAFFSKALDGRVQVRDPNGGVTVRQLTYSALDFIETEAGKLPVRSQNHSNATDSMTLWAVFGTNGRITRSGREIPDMIFLRDGDQVRLEARPHTIPQQQRR